MISAFAAIARKDGDNYRNRGVLVLQGRQGIGKTTFLRNLVGGDWGGNKLWFGEGLTLDPEIKDLKMSAISYWITELAELENTTKRGMPALKAFLTSNEDSLRKPYAAEETNFTRRTVFAGTVNEKGFLTDATGNSRFWVIPVKEFKDISSVDMQQVWAEVKELYEQGKQWWLKQEEEQILEERNTEYVSENAVESYLSKGLDWAAANEHWQFKTMTEALLECGMREPKSPDCKMAIRYVERLYGDNLQKSKRMGVRKYLLPPRKALAQKEWESGYTPAKTTGEKWDDQQQGGYYAEAES